MNSKTVILLAVVCVVLIAVSVSQRSKSDKAWSETSAKRGETVYPDFPIGEVDKIVITGESEVTLVKPEDSWQVQENFGYFAKGEQIGRFLKAVYELELKHTQTVGESFYHRLELAAPGSEKGAGTDVTFFKGSTKVASLRIGKEHKKQGGGGGGQFGGGAGGWPDGRYILNPATKTVAVVSETFAPIKPDVTSWVNTDFVKVKKPKRGTAKQGDKVLWAVSRAQESDSLALANVPDGREVDTSKVSSIDWALNYPRFESIPLAKGGDESEYGLEGGRSFELETFDGFTYLLSFGTLSDAKVPVKVAIEYQEPAAPQPTVVAEDATPEDKAQAAQTDKAALDAHNDAVKEAKDKLRDETQRFVGWVFLIGHSTVDDFLYSVNDLLKEPEAAEDAGAEMPSLPTLPQDTAPPQLPPTPLLIPGATPVPSPVAPPKPATPLTPPAPPPPAADSAKE